jgi:hypothetical protein
MTRLSGIVKRGLSIVELFFGAIGFFILLALFITYPPLSIGIVGIIIWHVIKSNQ